MPQGAKIRLITLQIQVYDSYDKSDVHRVSGPFHSTE